MLDMFLSYAAACAGRLWSVVVLILNALFLVGLVIGTVQSTARQSGILGAVAIPVIICIAITVAGTFPTSLPAALFSLGGALIGIGLFRLIQNLFNAEARYNRHASPSP
ncbi:hypothetical protein IJI72_01620 [Candidatus Saccharibacteria bacterium]|nr:hypothetical protein [Candidatus Saccharibacteria bacterium]